METHFSLTLNTSFIFDSPLDHPVLNAMDILRRDMGNVLETPQSLREAPLNSIHITEADTKLPAESWIVEAAAKELLVRYADNLGCVYALLFISKFFLGVTPFWFWNDQTFLKRASVRIPLQVWRAPVYAVRFRGWFVNDEVLIENWGAEQGNRKHWLMVFETLLRCGGNIIIPGTDVNSRIYRSMAADMGLWITHHHAEPLGAEMFSRIYPDEVPSYTDNKNMFEELWEQAVVKQKQFKAVWGLGFRGQGDRPFWADDPHRITAEQRGNLISDVINRQYEIIKKHIKNPMCCINLYGEITDLYRAGYLRLPAGLIKIWADNGYGRMVSRRQGNDNPRVHSLPYKHDAGPHGIYYHCSFHDLQASNHLTMSSNPVEFLAAELENALKADAGTYWIINCGSIKPHVYALDLISRIWQAGNVNVEKWRNDYAETYYGKKHAKAIAALFKEYPSCTARYGPNEDDRAGEQIWHHPVRELLCRWMAGDTENCLEKLMWLTGNVPFSEQAGKLEKISQETLPKWDAFCNKCRALRPLPDGDSGRLFDDSVFLQARLQQSGAMGSAAFCESLRAYRSGDMVNAFLLAGKAQNCYAEGVKELTKASHDKWAGYYDGDCLTDIRLTLFCMEALVSWLRVLGDGPDFHTWERDFLMPEKERKVMLLSSKKKALDNEKLAVNLEKILV